MELASNLLAVSLILNYYPRAVVTFFNNLCVCCLVWFCFQAALSRYVRIRTYCNPLRCTWCFYAMMIGWYRINHINVAGKIRRRKLFSLVQIRFMLKPCFCCVDVIAWILQFKDGWECLEFNNPSPSWFLLRIAFFTLAI